MAKSNFDKFINKPIKGAKKKEQFKQAKKKVKKAREEFFIEKKRADRAAKKQALEQQGLQQNNYDRKAGIRQAKKTYGKPLPGPTQNPAEAPLPPASDTTRRPAEAAGKRGSKIKPTERYSSAKPAHNPGPAEAANQRGPKAKPSGAYTGAKQANNSRPADRANDRRPKTKPTGGYASAKPANNTRPAEAANDRGPKTKPTGGYTKFAKPQPEATENGQPAAAPTQPAAPSARPPRKTTPGGPTRPQQRGGPVGQKPALKNGVPFERKPLKPAEIPLDKKPLPKPATTAKKTEEEPIMPLNKYLAHGGVTSRRDAGEMVKAGKVKVNNVVVQEPGYKVQPTDVVTIAGKRLVQQRNLVYVLLNKPKDFITTVDDPQGRKTVLDIVAKATDQRIYPVGRLDRNTSGVLLLTNDGDLAQQLTHPSFEVKKIYEARLDKVLSKADFETILAGITLEDGPVLVDSLAYADSKDKSVIGIEIHSGRNRIVRRLFEHLGYDVKNLDRVMFANLTKKNVERGKWRLLTDKEVRQLKFFGKGK